MAKRKYNYHVIFLKKERRLDIGFNGMVFLYHDWPKERVPYVTVGRVSAYTEEEAISQAKITFADKIKELEVKYASQSGSTP